MRHSSQHRELIHPNDLSDPQRSQHSMLLEAIRPLIEGLERRVLLSATITPTNIAQPTDSELVTVEYTSTAPIDVTTIRRNNISVDAPGGTKLNVTGVTTTGSGADVFATYAVATPNGGTWADTDNGTYTVDLPDNRVLDINGASVGSATSSFQVSVPDTVHPTATINAPADITAAGSNPATFTVVYSDDVAVDASTITSSNITANGPAGNLTATLTGTTPATGNAATITATYSLAAPAGGWTNADNGAYTIALAGGSVKDTSGNGIGLGSSGFHVNIAAPADTTPPTAVISASDIAAAGATTQTISVVYSDNVSVNASSIAKTNITVTGPSGPLAVQNVSKSSGDAASVTATYTVAAPGGNAWSAADNGTYTVALASNSVKDTSGNGVAAAAQTFKVNIPVPDTTPPTAAITAANVTAPGGSNEIVTVKYSDGGSGVAAGTVNNGSVTVTGPGGPLTLSNLSILPAVNSPNITAIYTFAAPGGAWTPVTNGTYTVAVVAGHVTDVAGNGISGSTATFTVNAGVLDTTPPTASIVAGNITSPGGTTETVTVSYADTGSGVDPNTIKTSNITVSGPGGPLTVSDVHTSVTGNNVIATYTVTAPGGKTWSFLDNGNYSVAVVGGSVKDNAGNGVAGTSGSFNVNAAIPDTTPPVATITAGNITSASSAPQTITVIYHDADSPVSGSSIDAANISASGPQGPLTVTGFTATPAGDAATITVTYSVAPPVGGWSNVANGTYSVALNGGQVKDPSGNAAAGSSTTFTVNIPAPGDPSDTTFNNGQPVTAQFVAESIVSLPNGQLLLAGHTGSVASGASAGVLERLNADGSLDTTFGNKGVLTTASSANDAYYDIILQGSDHVVVAGTNGSALLLQRFDLNGNLDATFGTNGTTLTSFGGTSDTAYSLALSPSGQIVAAGNSSGNFAFARYDSNGHLDTTFAQGGLQLFQVGSATGAVGSVVVQPDGKVVAVGAAGGAVAVVRLDATGEADPTFGNGGLVMATSLVVNQNLGAVDHSEGLALQGDGKILVAKRTADNHFGVERLNADGSVDTTFGAGGLAVANFGGQDDADSILVQPTGQILVLGTSLISGNPFTAVAAFDSTGHPIVDFGSNGTITFTALPSTTRELHVGDLVLRAFGTQQSNGQIVVGTSGSSVSSASTTALRRLIVPGSVGAKAAESFLGTFGISGKKSVKLTFTTPDGTAATLALSNGTGNAFLDGDQVRLTINQSGKGGAALTITTRGGTKAINLADVTVNGSLRSLSAKSADLIGTLYASSIGAVALRNINKGAVISASSISSLTAASLSSADIISGATLGTSGELASATSFGAGFIGSVRVGGNIASSLLAAGVDPINGNFLNGNDSVVGGASSVIKSVVAKNLDTASRLIAGKIGSVRAPKTIKSPDARLVILPA